MSNSRQWGGDLELSALADSYKCSIQLHIEGKKVEQIFKSQQESSEIVYRL